jgi:hypothetical protein
MLEQSKTHPPTPEKPLKTPTALPAIKSATAQGIEKRI